MSISRPLFYCSAILLFRLKKCMKSITEWSHSFLFIHCSVSSFIFDDVTREAISQYYILQSLMMISSGIGILCLRLPFTYLQLSLHLPRFHTELKKFLNFIVYIKSALRNFYRGSLTYICYKFEIPLFTIGTDNRTDWHRAGHLLPRHISHRYDISVQYQLNLVANRILKGHCDNHL